jgi:hypothetical protein
MNSLGATRGWLTLWTTLVLTTAFFGFLPTTALASAPCSTQLVAGYTFYLVPPAALQLSADAKLGGDVKGGPDKTEDQKVPDLKFIEVIGGSAASPQNWPATFILCLSGGKFCTSTAIGPQVVITAAHCFDGLGAGNSPVRGYVLVQLQPSIPINCILNPAYRPFDPAVYGANGNMMLLEWSADVAVCTADSKMPVSIFEVLNTAAGLIKVNGNVTLLGFGCTLSGGGGDVEKLNQGPAQIKEIQSLTYYFRTSRDLSVVAPSAALCKGDSGGATFSGSGNSRLVVGINSIADNKLESWITDVSRSQINQFINQQTRPAALHVCGIDPEVKGCRVYTQ